MTNISSGVLQKCLPATNIVLFKGALHTFSKPDIYHFCARTHLLLLVHQKKVYVCTLYFNLREFSGCCWFFGGFYLEHKEWAIRRRLCSGSTHTQRESQTKAITKHACKEKRSITTIAG